MSAPNPSLLALYGAALRLYPARLRLLYRDQMLQTIRDAHAERRHPPLLFWCQVFADLAKSCVKERLLMTRDEAMRRPIFFHAITLGLILTAWGFFAALTFQGVLRGQADQPQIQMAQQYSSDLASSQSSLDTIPARHIDPSTSLEPFVIVYDENGTPLRSSGYLGNDIPVPPLGVFNYLRVHSMDKFTWQPNRGIRIAAVARRIDGPRPGFVLVGRSLTLVQQQANALRRGTFITWFSLMALIAVGALFLNRAQNRVYTRPQPAD